jgi:hypothetical protein
MKLESARHGDESLARAENGGAGAAQQYNKRNMNGDHHDPTLINHPTYCKLDDDGKSRRRGKVHISSCSLFCCCCYFFVFIFFCFAASRK